jgi:hypothetical protein
MITCKARGGVGGEAEACSQDEADGSTVCAVTGVGISVTG